MKVSFDCIKEKVLEIIAFNKENEITKSTSNTTSGIYMLYVDDFSDDTIIPFYIGQTSNFQERYESHLKELLSLNRISCEHYKHCIIDNVYNGYYKACKIFTYLVNHRCSFENFHMIVIETIDDEEKRLQREDFYINNLYSSFLGFNQMNTVSKSKRLDYSNQAQKEKYHEIINQDIENLLEFSNYGYSDFNFFLGKEILKTGEKFELLLNNKTFNQLYIDEKKLKQIKSKMFRIDEYNTIISKKTLYNKVQSDIESYFLENKLQSNDKAKDIIQVLLFNDEDKKKEITNYIQRFAKVKKIDIFEFLYNKHQITVDEIRNKIIKNQEEYYLYWQEKDSILKSIFKKLLPINFYPSHPLKDMYIEHCFQNDDKDNVCYINIEYTCFKREIYYDFYPYICKIDYKILKNGEEKSRTAFIKNPLAKFWNNENIFYVERRYVGIYNMNFKPYNIFLRGNIDTHIPVSMEYKNGINEYTFKNRNFEDECDVFVEIDSFIDNETKIIYTTSGYKSTIQRYTYAIDKTPNGLLKKLIRASKQ